MSTDTTPAFSVTRDTRIKLPLFLLWSIVAAAALCGGYVYTLHARVDTHAEEIRGLKDEARTSRELLVRIDENVKALKEASRR